MERTIFEPAKTARMIEVGDRTAFGRADTSGFDGQVTMPGYGERDRRHDVRHERQRRAVSGHARTVAESDSLRMQHLAGHLAAERDLGHLVGKLLIAHRTPRFVVRFEGRRATPQKRPACHSDQDVAAAAVPGTAGGPPSMTTSLVSFIASTHRVLISPSAVR